MPSMARGTLPKVCDPRGTTRQGNAVIRSNWEAGVRYEPVKSSGSAGAVLAAVRGGTGFAAPRVHATSANGGRA